MHAWNETNFKFDVIYFSLPYIYTVISGLIRVLYYNTKYMLTVNYCLLWHAKWWIVCIQSDGLFSVSVQWALNLRIEYVFYICGGATNILRMLKYPNCGKITKEHLLLADNLSDAFSNNFGQNAARDRAWACARVRVRVRVRARATLSWLLSIRFERVTFPFHCCIIQITNVHLSA